MAKYGKIFKKGGLSMSRDWEGEDDSDYWMLNMGRWERNQRVVWRSKRGQKFLAEVRDALLAMPERKLTGGELAQPPEPRSGIFKIIDRFKPRPVQVCALGAWAMYKGVPVEKLLDAYGSRGSVEVAKELGMTQQMAYGIGYENDSLSHITPEERWERMFRLVSNAIETGVFA